MGSPDLVAKITHVEKQQAAKLFLKYADQWFPADLNEPKKKKTKPQAPTTAKILPSVWWEGCVKGQLQSFSNLWRPVMETIWHSGKLMWAHHSPWADIYFITF